MPTITGTDSSETLNAANGVTNGGDVIKGYRGNDRLAGWDGKDTFVFNPKLDGTDNVDVIVDFNPVDDTIQLDNLYFTSLKTVGWLAAGSFKDITAARRRPATGSSTTRTPATSITTPTARALLSTTLNLRRCRTCRT